MGIQPLATLYHWDLPAALDDGGGWLNRDSADWFADYARVLFDRLDGRVTRWVTINEPWVIADGGYLNGVLASGHRNRSEEHTSELQSLMRISYAVFCLKKKNTKPIYSSNTLVHITPTTNK